ncbi:MAG: hypothetical protein FK733_12540 [Asgard group archaeon]|nr:hypothetical protein [Asgard group archaeon]
MSKKSKILFNHNDIKSTMNLIDVINLVSSSHKQDAEYELTSLILNKLTSGNRYLTKEQMYDMYMRNRDKISKASYYRILTRLIDRGMVIFDEESQKYQVSILFSNALQKIAIAWEKITLEE